jgi:hypothetical protein
MCGVHEKTGATPSVASLARVARRGTLTPAESVRWTTMIFRLAGCSHAAMPFA